ncbi:MAG TPA: hypothetical protein VHA14_03235 [Bryobacteraceae bacterium]|nr:hypothetical protein [Bryobacteraceae bacterium]
MNSPSPAILPRLSAALLDAWQARDLHRMHEIACEARDLSILAASPAEAERLDLLEAVAVSLGRSASEGTNGQTFLNLLFHLRDESLLAHAG